MRRVVLAMNTTVNGRLDDPEAWFGGLTDDIYGEIDRGSDTFDTVLVGRVTYDEMCEYWPGAASEEGAPEAHRRMSEKMNSFKKYVFSRTPAAAPLAWNNSEIVTVNSDRDIVEFVQTLKDQPGRDIYLSGGARLAQTLVRLGLVDEYRFFVHPVFSAGESWFGQIVESRQLEAISAATYANGVVAMYYRRSGDPATTNGSSPDRDPFAPQPVS
ncbi:MAG TPA: dihydrofolate reductase family protein [Nocardioidaceae bacterium]|nr:dihydrofolate reductase family protein [Nocardioidaceae bacterium]